MRDEAEEEGYITRAKARRQARNGKGSKGGKARLVEISCADLVWKIRIVSSFISSSLSQSPGRIDARPFIPFPPPSTNFRQDTWTAILVTSEPTSYFLIQSPHNLIAVKLAPCDTPLS